MEVVFTIIQPSSKPIPPARSNNTLAKQDIYRTRINPDKKSEGFKTIAPI